jgi:hypothetical protein
MQLHLLRTTACLAIYYDSGNDWLFLDWAGKLTLPAVQEACVAVAQCYLQRAYSRVLNSNLHVTGSCTEVATWLGMEFLPYLAVAGVEHVAWISAPSSVGRTLEQTVLEWVSELVLHLFDTTDEAIAWLQQTRLSHTEGYRAPQWQPATQVRLAQQVQVLQHRVAKRPAELQRA